MKHIVAAVMLYIFEFAKPATSYRWPCDKGHWPRSCPIVSEHMPTCISDRPPDQAILGIDREIGQLFQEPIHLGEWVKARWLSTRLRDGSTLL